MMEATLSLRREQLLYDIANYAYIEGHKREIEGGCPIGAHMVTDIAHDGNADRVDRLLAATHACVVEMLSPLSAAAPVDETIDDRPWTPEVYAIRVRVPDTMSRTTLHMLARLAHEYMVSAVLADWLSIVCPAAAAPWRDKAAQAAAAISVAYRRRTGPLIRRSSPW